MGKYGLNYQARQALMGQQRLEALAAISGFNLKPENIENAKP